MTIPALFTTVEINGKSYRLQDVQPQADGSAVWLVSRSGRGAMYSVDVAADGSFGAVRFMY